MVSALSRAFRPVGTSLPLRARTSRCVAFTILFLLSLASTARAVIVRGRMTDALGAPVGGGKVQLLQGTKVVAFAYAAADGSYEIRYSGAGRFALVGTAATFLPSIGSDFYGGTTDVVEQDVVVAANTVRQDVSVTATGLPTPLPQLTAPVSVLPGELMATDVGVVNSLRQEPGAFVVQQGQTGGVTSLFLRGGNSTANLVLVDGIPAEDIGGTFDYGTVSSTAIGSIEVYRGPNSAIYGTDAGAAVVSISTPRGTTGTPVLTYSGDAGNLHTWRNEVTLGGTARKLDYYGAFSRFDTSNALADDRYHSGTAAANVGYDINGNTLVRATIRNADSVTGLPDAHDFYGVPAIGREGDQDLYAGLTVENTYRGDWHNLVRYGIARKREQAVNYGDLGTPITLFPGFTEDYGRVVTIRGANGYSATGQAAFINGSDDQDSNRDQLYYQSDWSPSRHFNGLFGFRYDNERGSFNSPPSAFSAAGSHEKTQRTNFEYNLQFQGEFFHRLFYSAGGAVEKNHLYGIAGTPRLGLSYVPVRPSAKPFHGTRLRANAATGVQEPTLALDYFSLYRQLLVLGLAADVAAYHIGPPTSERSRTYDLGVDQNVFGEKLTLKAGYFHNVFDHQLESVTGPALAQYFGINIPALLYKSEYVNSLAFRAQGEELELAWHPRNNLLFRGGYTHLDTRVVQSFASDAVAANQSMPNENPNIPGVPIGFESPLVGARPFRRAPNTGYIDAQYARKRLSLTLRGALASRSDDTTFLDGYDINFGNSLVLPNRDLDFGYVKLDLGGTYAWKHGISVFSQVENLLNDQHIGPIGYPGLPLTFRTGLKVRLGGN